MRQFRYIALCCIILLFAMLAISPLSTSTAQTGQTATPMLSSTPSAILTVNTLTDIDGSKCDASECSLREAIAAAPSGALIKFSSKLAGTLVVNKKIQISKNLSISGVDLRQDQLTISGNDQTIIFDVLGFGLPVPVTLSLDHLTIAHGGKGINSSIFSSGILNIAYVIFRDNFSGEGTRAIDNSGTANISYSTFQNNETTTSGGAISNSGTLNISNSTFVDNKAKLNGAAILNNGSLRVMNCTFMNNQASDASTIVNYGAVEIVNSTLFDGTIGSNYIIDSSQSPTGLFPSITLRNTIIGHINGLNCIGNIIDGGNNLQWSGTIVPGDSWLNCNGIRVGDLKLGPLQDNGGPTQTIALLPGSAALNTGNPAFCSSTDQRGATLANKTTCDIGAFQHEGILPAVASTPATSTP